MKATPSRSDLERRIAALEAEVATLRADPRGAGDARQFFQVVDTLPLGIVVHRGGAARYANRALPEMLGVSHATYMAAASALDWVHERDRPAVTDFVRRYLGGEPLPAHGEFRLVRSDGATLWVESHTTRVTWDGEPALVSALTDIGDRREADRELRESRKLFQSIFHASTDVATVADLATGCFVDVNRTFLEYSPRPREAVIGRPLVEAGLFAGSDFRNEALRRVAEHGSMRDVEVVARTVRGERIFVLSAEKLQVGDRRLMLSVARDVTDWRRHEQELRRSHRMAERANRAKSEFLASMSHELRTPLNAIIGFSEVIRDGIFGPIGVSRYAEYAKDINESGQHLLQIINDLLDLTKLEAGKVDLHQSAVAPAQVIEACLRLVSTRAENGGIAVERSVPADLPQVMADARLLKQVMINLLSNAVKFTPRGGRVVAGAERAADGGLALYVADTGIGMSPGEIEIALTPFGQVDGVLSRKHQGTGLGLPLARSLAELHDGTLTVGSVPGEGTTVTVALPAGRVIPAVAPAQAAAG